VANASRRDTMKSAIKACNLNLVVRIMIRIIETRTRREIAAALMALN